MNTSEGIELEHIAAVSVITLRNEKKRNAFTPEMRRELTGAIVSLNKTPVCRVIVLTGADGHFCAGADVSRMRVPGAVPRTVIQTRENTKEVDLLIEAIIGAPKPIIAAVEGDAFGGGMAIAVACDFVIATRSARFGTAFTKIGLLPDMGMLYTLPQRVGLANAKRLLMLPKAIGGEEAHTLGIVDQLAESSARETALMLAEELASAAPLPIAYIKAAYAEGVLTWRDALRAELDYGAQVSASADSKEGVSALKEKRTPNFTGQ